MAAEATEHLNLALEMAIENMNRWKEEEDIAGGFYA